MASSPLPRAENMSQSSPRWWFPDPHFPEKMPQFSDMVSLRLGKQSHQLPFHEKENIGNTQVVTRNDLRGRIISLRIVIFQV